MFAQLCPPTQEKGGGREPPFSRKRPAAATARYGRPGRGVAPGGGAQCVGFCLQTERDPRLCRSTGKTAAKPITPVMKV